jgi:dipeptidase
VAQRVPDGHYFVAANEFRIREIFPDNPDQIYGPTLHAVIEAAGWRSPQDRSQPLDWLSSVSKGEYNHPYYSLRRVWRAFSLAAPSLKLPAWVDSGKTRAYPFSVKPDRKMTLDDVQKIHRDYYQGTEFDLTQGTAAGPFGSPARYLGPNDPSGDVSDSSHLPGAWERPLSMYYTGYTFINQLSPKLPYPLNAVSWVALGVPGESVFVPLPVGPLPAGYEKGDPSAYDPEMIWWTYEKVCEYANLKYSYMIKDISARAGILEKRSRKLLTKITNDLKTLAKTDPQAAASRFAGALAANALEVRSDWEKLFTDLFVKYDQGFLNTPEKMAQPLGYSQKWLDLTNYSKGPTAYEKQ